jgi:hypothetical protein
MEDTINESNELDWWFDDLLIQVIRGNLSHEAIENGRRIEMFRQVKDWKALYGYKFNIYSNDHLIDGKKHFHFDNNAADVHSKLDFEGNVLEETSKPIPANILKELLYFMNNSGIKEKLHAMWDEQNPTLKHEI